MAWYLCIWPCARHGTVRVAQRRAPCSAETAMTIETASGLWARSLLLLLARSVVLMAGLVQTWVVQNISLFSVVAFCDPDYSGVRPRIDKRPFAIQRGKCACCIAKGRLSIRGRTLE